MLSCSVIVTDRGTFKDECRRVSVISSAARVTRVDRRLSRRRTDDLDKVGPADEGNGRLLAELGERLEHQGRGGLDGRNAKWTR